MGRALTGDICISAFAPAYVPGYAMIVAIT
jgi:hypothetical protein